MNQKEMDTALEKAKTLVEALPYIRKFNRKIVVIKYGGSAMKTDDLKNSVIEDAILLKLVGFKPIIVHGGGKEISQWVEKTGGKSTFVNGFRVTDSDTMTIAEMVLNRVNKELVTKIESQEVKAAGISGKDGGLLRVQKKMPDGQDIGYVGDIKLVDPEILFDLLEKDFLPVVCPIGFDDNYETYNINADDAACAIATAVGADKLVFLTDIGGLYRDLNDEDTKISRLTVSEAEELIDSGIVGGGMLPKISNCTSAVRAGVNRVHILDGRIPHSILLEIFTDQGIGTMFFRDEDADQFNNQEG
ncbi:MAG: acetylglutamate kinase [Lachnospiraceae bacterium]|nr:acetylglutamate kinase [Lachnospiraceae bacterium]